MANIQKVKLSMLVVRFPRGSEIWDYKLINQAGFIDEKKEGWKEKVSNTTKDTIKARPKF